MGKIPKAKRADVKNISPDNLHNDELDKTVCFSFETLDKTEYFNLDGTCVNWSSDLFDTFMQVSKIQVKDIYAGKYSGKQSPFRIHQHKHVNPPSKVPVDIDLSEMWQIRISVSKGGVHGILHGNVFYVVWLDPQHNLYPDENHGNLKRIIPPSTCCKERDMEIDKLKKQIEELKQYKDMIDERTKPNNY